MYAGNALQLTVVPPVGALRWRVLRQGIDSFSGPTDSAALVAYEGTEPIFIDSAVGLINQAPAFYRAYYWDGTVWTASVTAQGTPDATYADQSVDALTIVRERLEAGMAVEIAAGRISNTNGHIRVLTAPPVANEVELPIVTITLESEPIGERGVGEQIGSDTFDGVDWTEHDGYIASVRLNIVCWSLNPDERVELRKALRRILVANLPVFDFAGLVLVEFTFRDADLLEGQFEAPVYQVVVDFSCQAPVVITNEVDAISDVIVTDVTEAAAEAII